jgi:hypothetical protein
MGDVVDPRREFIQGNVVGANQRSVDVCLDKSDYQRIKSNYAGQ